MTDKVRKRALAIDYGTKRVGIAISDPLRLFPSVLLAVKNDKNILADICKIISDKGVDRIILGYPESENGKKSELADQILKFREALEAKSKIKVQLWNEHLTSKMAEMRIINTITKKSKRRDKSLIDAHSAGIMLEEYLRSIENINHY
jgi:putative Holliday junction resolvase